MQTRRIDKFTESSPVMIISSVQGIIFPLELSLPALRSLHRAHESTFLLLLYFFIPSFLFNLRFKVVIFSRPPFFQPVPRFASLLIFFFGRSCAFVFEVQGLASSSWIFSLPRAFEFFTHSVHLALSIYFFIIHVRSAFPVAFPLISGSSLSAIKFLRYFPFPFHLISLDRARLPLSLSTTSYSGTSSWLHSLLNNRRSPLSVSLFPVYESLHFPSSSLSTFQLAISMPPSYFTFAYSFDREFRSLSHFFLFSFTLPFFFLLLLSVSSLTRRALQAPQSYLVIQLFDVEKGEYPFSLSLRTLSVPSTCNHRGEQSLQSEREKRC